MTNENINDYCTAQNIVVRYPNGAAGKFLITCLFLMQRVAHWDAHVQQDKKSAWEWFKTAWPKDISQWSVVEPNQPWATNFFSRRLSRNNQLTCAEYNQLVDANASDYFHQCWNQELYIVDHWHKRSRPLWQAHSHVIEITLNDQSLEHYKQLIAKKLWLWDAQRNVVISTLDHPDYAHDENSREQRLWHSNAYELTGFKDYDDFFYNYLVHQPFVKSFINTNVDHDCLACFDLLDLFRFDTLSAKLTNMAKMLDTEIDLSMLEQMHAFWCDRSHITNFAESH